MSFSPSVRLLWFIGLVFVPACALPAVAPRGEEYLLLVGFAIAGICLFDLILAQRTLDGFSVSVPEHLRATLQEEKKFAVAVYRGAAASSPPRQIRLASVFPPQLKPVCEEVVIASPDRERGVQTELSFVGRERGAFQISTAMLGSLSRLGFWDLRRSIEINCRILVEPPLSQIAKQASKLLASRRHGGQRIVARNGRGREFQQLREYVPSDDFGDIDWKATARRRRPIVREYQIERTQDIYACVDFSRLSAQEISKKNQTRTTILDEYIRSTLILHRTVREAGDRFGFATFSNRVGCFIKAAPATSFDAVFRRALYPLQSAPVTPAYDEICSTFRTRAKRRALIIFFTSLSEPQLAESFLEASRLLARQHVVVIACPADFHVQHLFAEGGINDVEDIYGRLAGHLLWKTLADLRANLMTVGIRMHSLAPDRLGLAAATEYLDVKERQLL